MSRYLPYLLNRAGVRIGLAFSEEVARYRITMPMWRVLSQLWGEAYRSQRELGALTSTDPATLSRLVRSMEARGLVTRRRPREDAREVRVRLTTKGRELTKRLIPLALEYEAFATEGIPPVQLELVKGALARMYNNIAAHHERMLQAGLKERKAGGARARSNRVRRGR